VKVIPTQVLECSWDLSDPLKTCTALGSFVRSLKLKGYIPIIFASKKDWTQFFQGVAACNTFARDYSAPLIYANYGPNNQLVSTPSYSDFSPFGGWTYAIGKKIMGNVKVQLNCGPTPQNVTVEKYLSPRPRDLHPLHHHLCLTLRRIKQI
jgi:hypothetical protein